MLHVAVKCGVLFQTQHKIHASGKKVLRNADTRDMIVHNGIHNVYSSIK